MLKLKTGYHMKQRMKSGTKNHLDQANIILTPRNRNYKIKQFRAHKFQMAKLTRNVISRCREIQRDREIPYRYQMQIGQEVISYNILTYLPSQKKLENLANRNHETPDLRPEGTKSGNSSSFVISRRDN